MIGHSSMKAPTSPKTMGYKKADPRTPKKTDPRSISQGKKQAARSATSSKYIRTKAAQSKTGTPQGSMGTKSKYTHPSKKTTVGTKPKRAPKMKSKGMYDSKESYKKAMDSHSPPKEDTKGKETRRPRKDRRPRAKSKASDRGAKKRTQGLRRAMRNKRRVARKSKGKARHGLFGKK